MNRHQQLQHWLESLSPNTYINIQPASADASFRQYFRVKNISNSKNYIVMDAPPEKEDCQPFVQVTELIRQSGVNAPDILALDLEQGFLLLDDLGERPYLEVLNEDNADKLYSDAITALVNMQSINAILPVYNRQLLQAELDLFETWYVNKHLGVELTAEQKQSLQSVFDYLIANAEQQPQVFVHRDYHSRNLMFTENNNPGVIDYQDAVIGPITYDLVSLFKDCYIEWPREKVEHWLELYLAQLSPTFLIEKSILIPWFDLMGVQRHLKVLGIFSRLNYRDGKSQYLNDLPLTYKYITDTSSDYPELAPLTQLLEQLSEKIGSDKPPPVNP